MFTNLDNLCSPDLNKCSVCLRMFSSAHNDTGVRAPRQDRCEADQHSRRLAVGAPRAFIRRRVYERNSTKGICSRSTRVESRGSRAPYVKTSVRMLRTCFVEPPSPKRSTPRQYVDPKSELPDRSRVRSCTGTLVFLQRTRRWEADVSALNAKATRGVSYLSTVEPPTVPPPVA